MFKTSITTGKTKTSTKKTDCSKHKKRIAGNYAIRFIYCQKTISSTIITAKPKANAKVE